jgi:hypothetical protein
MNKYHHLNKDEVKNMDRMNYKLVVVVVVMLLAKGIDNYCPYNQKNIRSSM